MVEAVSDHRPTDVARPEPRPGLSGTVGLFDLEKLDLAGLVEQLQLVRSLIGWAEAGEVKVLAELDQRFRDEARDVSHLDPRVDPEPVRKREALWLPRSRVRCGFRSAPRRCVC